MISLRNKVKYNIVPECRVRVADYMWDLEDLYETMCSIKYDEIMVDYGGPADSLIEAGIMSSNGSIRGGYGASAGENFDEWKIIVEAALDRYEAKIKKELPNLVIEKV